MWLNEKHLRPFGGQLDKLGSLKAPSQVRLPKGKMKIPHVDKKNVMIIKTVPQSP